MLLNFYKWQIIQLIISFAYKLTQNEAVPF